MDEIIVIRAADPGGSVFQAVMDALNGKRAEVVSIAASVAPVLRIRELEIYHKHRRVFMAGKEVHLNHGEYTIGPFNLGAVNGIHSQIEKMLPESAERLPATKYLNQYMALFIWLWQHKGLPLADKELLLKRTIADSYDYAENYDKIKVRPMDINTKGEFPLVV